MDSGANDRLMISDCRRLWTPETLEASQMRYPPPVSSLLEREGDYFDLFRFLHFSPI